jgi:uncharacterized protein
MRRKGGYPMPALNMLQILALYGALLGLIFMALSVLTIRTRRAQQISLGTGDDETLQRRMRAHANFAEYVPLALILLAGTAIMGAHAWFIHAGGALLCAGRLAHAGAILSGTLRFRAYGMVATFLVILAASIHILASFVAQL